MEQICRACREGIAPLVDIFDDVYQQKMDLFTRIPARSYDRIINNCKENTHADK